MILSNEKEIRSNEISEPVTTLLDTGKYFRVVAEFPDVSEESIQIDLENTMLAISAPEPESGKNIKKMIALPFKVRLDKKKFQNGILDLTLEKNQVDQIIGEYSPFLIDCSRFKICIKICYLRKNL
jgi:HSP20 family molecular chaperone IbpA